MRDANLRAVIRDALGSRVLPITTTYMASCALDASIAISEI